jgi:hypothetical protein
MNPPRWREERGACVKRWQPGDVANTGARSDASAAPRKILRRLRKRRSSLRWGARRFAKSGAPSQRFPVPGEDTAAPRKIQGFSSGTRIETPPRASAAGSFFRHHMHKAGSVGIGGVARPLHLFARQFAHCGRAATPLQKFGTCEPFLNMSQTSPQPPWDKRSVQAHCWQLSAGPVTQTPVVTSQFSPAAQSASEMHGVDGPPPTPVFPPHSPASPEHPGCPPPPTPELGTPPLPVLAPLTAPGSTTTLPPQVTTKKPLTTHAARKTKACMRTSSRTGTSSCKRLNGT